MGDDQMSGPNGMAIQCQRKLAELEAEEADCTDRRRKKEIKRQMRQLRDLLRFAKTRAGYTGS